MARQSRYQRFFGFWTRSWAAVAVETARNYLADFPDDRAAWVILGDSLSDLARYAEAEDALGKALELSKPAECALPLAYFGHLERKRGQYEQAAAYYRRAHELEPDNGLFLVFLGGALARLGQHSDAEQAYRLALDCAKVAADEAYCNLGLVLRAQGRFEESAECLRKALELDPEYRVAKDALCDVEWCLVLQRKAML